MKLRNSLGLLSLILVLLVGIFADLHDTESYLNNLNYNSIAKDYDRDGDSEKDQVSKFETFKIMKFAPVSSGFSIIVIVPLLAFKNDIPQSDRMIPDDFVSKLFRPPAA